MIEQNVWEPDWNSRIENPAGFGVSNETTWRNMPVDSGIISIASFARMAGSFLFRPVLFAPSGKAGEPQGSDEFMLVSRSIVIALLAQIVGGNIFVGINGVMFWTFVAMSFSGTGYLKPEGMQNRVRCADEEPLIA